MSINFQEHTISGYPDRTRENVWLSDGTLIINRIESAGEKLTIKCCNTYKKPYLCLSLSDFLKIPKTPSAFDYDRSKDSVESTAAHIGRWISANNIHHLNVAGNGIYHLPYLSQYQVDERIYALFAAIPPHTWGNITMVRSGGQTGIDEAGVKAASRLGMSATVLAPKGWWYRDERGMDHRNDYEGFINRFKP